MLETNPFRPFIPKQPRLLILGSFPCFNGVDYGPWYYSGSGRSFFWPLLADLFRMPAGTLAQKKAICEAHGIALADVALRVRRNRGNCSDSNLQIVELNQAGVGRCLDSGVKRVFFTSRFVERQFLKMFPGCALPCFLLPSPSPAANRHIGGLDDYRNLLRSKKISSVYEYRLERYRELLTDF